MVDSSDEVIDGVKSVPLQNRLDPSEEPVGRGQIWIVSWLGPLLDPQMMEVVLQDVCALCAGALSCRRAQEYLFCQKPGHLRLMDSLERSTMT